MNLLSHDATNWNEDKIKSIFSTQKAYAILSIPLSTNRCLDGWQWVHNYDGFYFVKSGYRILQQTHTYHRVLVWNALWNLNIPPKVKHFVWRACQDCLPTCCNLVSNGVNVDIFCPLCESTCESTTHIPLDYPLVRTVWMRSGLTWLRGVSF